MKMDSLFFYKNVSILAINKLKERLGAFFASLFSQESKPIITGVTGTNGKTSICFFMAQLLQALNHKTCNFRYNRKWGLSRYRNILFNDTGRVICP